MLNPKITPKSFKEEFGPFHLVADNTQQSKDLIFIYLFLAIDHCVNYNVAVDLEVDHILYLGVHHVSLALGKLLDLPPLANVIFLGLASCCHHKT
jgi:hypothetical protein